jgi:hypothetical protein
MVERSAIDATMERASAALVETEYFETERLCVHALSAARRVNDFERMARIVLPLQEARRQLRQRATDAGRVIVAGKESELNGLREGCYLLRPPLIGADARSLRLVAIKRRSAVFMLTREPMTKLGQWPIVALGRSVICRVRLDPPEGVEPDPDSPTRDRMAVSDAGEVGVPVKWLVAAEEALGDAAIASVDANEPAAWRVDDLLDRLDAVPTHEKMHQALAETCREAVREPVPEGPRRRAVVDDPFSF